MATMATMATTTEAIEHIPVATLVAGINRGSASGVTSASQRRRVEEAQVEEFERALSVATAGGHEPLQEAIVDVVVSVEPTSVVPIPHDYNNNSNDDDDVSSSISGSGCLGSSFRPSRGAQQQNNRSSPVSALASIVGNDNDSTLTESENEKQRHKRRRTFITLGVLAAVAIVAVAAGVGAYVGASSGQSQNQNPSNTLSSPPALPTTPDSVPLPEEGADHYHDNTMYLYPIDLSEMEESQDFIDLRNILEVQLGDEAEPLYDRSTPQYRALYWLANQDAYYQDTILTDQANAAPERILQRYSLAALYYATSIDGGWGDTGDYLSPKDECEWSSVSCDDRCEWIPHLACVSTAESNRWVVTSLSLERSNLQGPIPLELFHLTGLVDLQLQNNHLSGSIPSQIAYLSQLDRLDLSRNDMTGSIPEEIGTVAADVLLWRYIFLSGNRLSGTLPSTWPPTVQQLYLNGNVLSGTVPRAYAKAFSQLSLLHIENNLLTGSINFLCDALVAGVQVYADTDEIECRCCN